MNNDLLNLYWMLVAAGFVFIAAEIFVPGAILGIMGTASLFGAMLVGFVVFGLAGGFISAILLLVGGTIFLSLWVKYCPKSFFGKWFTLQEDGRENKSFDDRTNELLGKTGVAQTDLRPAGIVVIDQRKVDVVSEAGFINKGTTVKVIHVAGYRVVVRPIESA
jgi:membrane-bound serine protease (ClpP class)